MRFLFVAWCALPFFGRAQTNSPDKFVLAATNTIGEQLFVLVTSADVAGTVTDDAMIGAIQDAKLSGSVSNDLWMVALQSVDVSGHVGDHARLASAIVEVSGTFARSLAAAGQSIHLATNSAVGEDAYLAGMRVAMEGHVASNVFVQAISATIGGHIQGTARVTASDIAVLPNTRIDGDLIYTSQKELFLDKSIVVAGKLKHELPPPVAPFELLAAQFTGTLVLSFGALLTGILFVFLFPRFTGHSVRLLRHATWRCVFTGAFVATTLPIAAIFAITTLVAAPLGATLLSALCLLSYLGNVIVALAIGGALLRQNGPQPLGRVLPTLALGLLLLYAIKALPYIGLFFSLTGWFAGTGALLLNMIHSQRMIPPVEPPPVPGDGEAKKAD
jgi:hypothetical protein